MKFKHLLFRIGGALCSFAFIIALSSMDTMCIASFHQPKVPENLTNIER